MRDHQLWRPTGPSATARLYILPDSDHDGLPDAWETSHPGFNPNDPSDGKADADGDGMSNANEYIAGTDYLDPQSNLKIEFLPNSLATLRFTAISNRTYTIQYKDDLSAAAWSRLADFLQTSNNRTETYTDSSPHTNRFYRLIIPIQR